MILDFNQNRSIMAVAVAGMLIMSACSSQTKHQTTASADTAIMVTLEKPMANNQEALNISGQIEAVQSANISTKIMGVINTINVKVGDHVNRGQVLAAISNDDIVAKKHRLQHRLLKQRQPCKMPKKILTVIQFFTISKVPLQKSWKM